MVHTYNRLILGISKEKMNEIEAAIAADRKKLEGQKDMAEEEKKKVEDDLEKKEAELQKAQWVYCVAFGDGSWERQLWMLWTRDANVLENHDISKFKIVCEFYRKVLKKYNI